MVGALQQSVATMRSIAEDFHMASIALHARQGGLRAEGDTTQPVRSSPRRFIAGTRLSTEETMKENLVVLPRACHYNELIPVRLTLSMASSADRLRFTSSCMM